MTLNSDAVQKLLFDDCHNMTLNAYRRSELITEAFFASIASICFTLILNWQISVILAVFVLIAFAWVCIVNCNLLNIHPTQGEISQET